MSWSNNIMIISNSSWSLQLHYFLSKSCLSFTVHTHQNQSLNTRNQIVMHLNLEKWKTLLFFTFWPNIFPILLLSNNAKNKIKAKPQCHAMNIYLVVLESSHLHLIILKVEIFELLFDYNCFKVIWILAHHWQLLLIFKIQMPTAWPHFEFNGYVTYLPTESYKYNWDVLFCQTETWVESNYLHLDWMNEWIHGSANSIWAQTKFYLYTENGEGHPPRE